jgi:hypothetical protein
VRVDSEGLRRFGNAHFAALQATFGDGLIQESDGRSGPLSPRHPDDTADRTYGRESQLRAQKHFQFEAITANTKRLFRCSAVSRNERHFVMSCRCPALQRPGFSSCVRRGMLTWLRRSDIRFTVAAIHPSGCLNLRHQNE